MSLQQCLEYAARGWRVIPIPPAKKFPEGIGQWQQKATTNPNQIEAWWGNDAPYENYGIGIATGKESGIFVVDIDDHDAYKDFESKHGELPDTLTSITGSGGQHLIYQYPAGKEIRNSAGTKLGQGLDIRGDGGFIVAPPSIHPYGTKYEWDLGQPDEPVEAPSWLIELLTREPEQRTTTKTSIAGDRPGDLWAADTDWAEILIPDGWTLSHTDRTGERHWTRPGKDKRDGTSATTGFTQNDNLKVFTSSLQHVGLEPESTYSKLGYIAATRFDGDHSAAAAALAEQGWSAPEASFTELFAVNLQETVQETAEPMPLRPLEDAKDLPIWPTHALPDWVRDHVEETATRLQVPVDLCAQLALGALASITMGHVTVEIQPGWDEPTNLYVWCALHSGAGKSPAEKAIFGPVREFEKTRRAATEQQFQTEYAEWKVAQKRVTELERKAGQGNNEAHHELMGLVVQAQQEPPVPYRLTVDDATPEQLLILLSKHKQLSIASSEGGLFDMVAGQFAKGQRPNVDVYLKAWSGDSMTRDRKGDGAGGPEHTTIDNALLSMVIAIQPSVIDTYQRTSHELRGRGFFARFMPSIPQVQPGQKIFGGDSRPGVEQQRYEETLGELANRLAGELGRHLSFDPDAQQLFWNWANYTETQIQPGGPLNLIFEQLPKIRSSVARTAAILATASGHTRSIPADILADAITVGEYWISHAVELEQSGLTGINADTALAKQIVQWADPKEETELTPRDVYLGLRHKLKLRSTEDLIPGFEYLYQRGWLVFTKGTIHDIGLRGKIVTFIVRSTTAGFEERTRENHRAFSTSTARSFELTPQQPQDEPENARNRAFSLEKLVKPLSYSQRSTEEEKPLSARTDTPIPVPGPENARFRAFSPETVENTSPNPPEPDRAFSHPLDRYEHHDIF